MPAHTEIRRHRARRRLFVIRFRHFARAPRHADFRASRASFLRFSRVKDISAEIDDDAEQRAQALIDIRLTSRR